MLEVEQKFAIADRDALFDQLEHLGATRGICLEQQDFYFMHPVRNFAETDEAIRIRCNGSENRITYKGPKRATISKVRKEIELAFESGQPAFEQMAEMLELLGFQPLRTIKKRRTPFTYLHHHNSFEIAIDEVEGLGTFAEIELMAEESGLQEAETAIIQLAETLVLTDSILKSYLGMLIENETQTESP
ncbi:MAG: class IV adenylate cyclase [Planctomycetes bacterium]|nr:class IV adenylate cyclase [Planctomycetota bacterium]MCH9727979.1 class IV adenylate cyclase [Planctomycetota bacterium]MCH9775781.1 class IV adenylate cyclase [Planctomycetota bacterium]MCH9790605.1 class IV adenylate cyclase [Planctomycetota bacterium]